MRILERVQLMQEKIQQIVNNMSVKYIVSNYIKLRRLELDIRRYIAKELKKEGDIQFTSQDVRALVMAIKAIHKKLNNIIDFSQFKKRFNKYDKVSNKEIKIEVLKIAEYMRCARDLQEVYSKLCYDEVILDFVEMRKAQVKAENEELLSKAILEGLQESYYEI